jgi:hypothetical protein
MVVNGAPSLALILRLRREQASQHPSRKNLDENGTILATGQVSFI